jgi:hypothetical protein
MAGQTTSFIRANALNCMYCSLTDLSLVRDAQVLQTESTTGSVQPL